MYGSLIGFSRPFSPGVCVASPVDYSSHPFRSWPCAFAVGYWPSLLAIVWFTFFFWPVVIDCTGCSPSTQIRFASDVQRLIHAILAAKDMVRSIETSSCMPFGWQLTEGMHDHDDFLVRRRHRLLLDWSVDVVALYSTNDDR